MGPGSKRFDAQLAESAATGSDSASSRPSMRSCNVLEQLPYGDRNPRREGHGRRQDPHRLRVVLGIGSGGGAHQGGEKGLLADRALPMARCPWCQREALRIIAAITQGEVIRKILRHLQLAVDPPPMAPARVRQAAFAWSSAWSSA